MGDAFLKSDSNRDTKFESSFASLNSTRRLRNMGYNDRVLCKVFHCTGDRRRYAGTRVTQRVTRGNQ